MNIHVMLLVLLDMSAAFDTLNHDALTNRLFAIGFRTKELSLLKSYIQNRFSEVKIGSECSKPRLHTHRVPRGSVIGTILFNIYLSPIFKLFLNHPTILFHTFADDFQIYTKTNSHDDISAHTRLTSCILELITWFTINSLQINITETKIIYISHNKTSKPLLFTFRFATSNFRQFA